MPTATTPLRERILDVAHQLVLERGFSGTSVTDVLGAAGASKGAFFHHFPSKAALGHALVERYAADDVALLDEYLARADDITDDPAQQLVEFVRAFEEDADQLAMDQPGCLFVSFVYEQVPETDEIRDIIAGAVELWRRRLLERLERAAADGRIPADVDLPSLADQVFTTFEGAFILARATGDPTHVGRQLAHLRHYLELLVGATTPVAG